MKIERAFTKAGASPYAAIAFRSASSEIRNPDGSVVFAATELEVPAGWSQVAIDVLAQKYFRKAGVPARLKPVREKGEVVPAINEALSIDGPVLLDFVVEQEENVYPMVAPGAPVHNMIRRPRPWKE